MTQKRLDKILFRLLIADIEYETIEDKEEKVARTVVKIFDNEFEIARRSLNKQTLTEGEDWILIMDENSTLQKDSTLLTSKLNFIYERQLAYQLLERQLAYQLLKIQEEIINEN